MSFEEETQKLMRAEKERKAIGPVSHRVPGGLSLDAAHLICEGNIQKRIKAGEKVVGFKVGYTNIPVREKMGLPDSTYGYIMDSMVLKPGDRVATGELIEPKIECEICLKMGKDLKGKNLSIEDVLGATESVSASFEICDARIIGWKCPYPDIFADNGFACRVVLPGIWHPVAGIDLLEETVVLRQNGEKISEGRGDSAMGHPANAVSWLVGKLADGGKGLTAGQFVMTGTLTPIIKIEKGATYTATFSRLGEIDIRFL